MVADDLLDGSYEAPSWLLYDTIPPKEECCSVAVGSF